MMGKGIAIVPTDGTIYAPFSGTLTVFYDSKHAYGIRSDKGTELLIHIGIDTVNLKGKHFTTNKKQGDAVQKGEVLGTFDRKAIEQAGYDTTVMLVVTNTGDYKEVTPASAANVNFGEDILTVQA